MWGPTRHMRIEFMDPDDRKLYEANTYARTPRLETLLEAESVEAMYDYDEEDGTLCAAGWPEEVRPVCDSHDIVELWQVFEEGSITVGYTPTLKDFVEWLTGTGEFKGAGKAEVTW